VGILVIFIFVVLPPILALITLACVPRFRLTIINFLLFVVGALVGVFVLGGPLEFALAALANLGSRTSLSVENNIAFLSMVVGMLAGGAGLVWLKLRFAGKPLKR